MNANQIYALPPEKVTTKIGSLMGCYYNHIPEVDYAERLYSVEQNLIEIKKVKFFNFDGRRYWSLQTVWFDKAPVMIIQNAGREGDDHAERFITDLEHFWNMIKFIRDLVPPSDDFTAKDIIDPDEDIPGLTEFYGNSLDGVFERY
jgi:hypothetical protein